MTHPIFAKWPAQHPDRLQLFSAPTPNGVKVGIMLEETALPYEPHRVDIMANESHDPAFLAVNPNGKIPAILDPNGPGGKPLALFESGAILIYLADKSGQFLSADPATRYETIQWLMWQMGGAGPMFGQLGFFHKFAGKDYEDKRPRDRYARMDHRRWLQHRRHFAAGLGAQPDRLLRCRRDRRVRALRPCPALARRRAGAAGGAARAGGDFGLKPQKPPMRGSKLCPLWL
jgi:glutathione S-transferase